MQKEPVPIDGTSVIGSDYFYGDRVPATCEGVSETAGRLIAAAIRICEEDLVDNSHSTSILIREALMWIKQLERWSQPDPPSTWELPAAKSLASIRDLVVVASDLTRSEPDRWVLDYLVMAIEERSCEIPQRLIDALQPESCREIDRLAGEHPEKVEACVARLVAEAHATGAGGAGAHPADARRGFLEERDRIELQALEVRRNVDSLLDSERERIDKALEDAAPDGESGLELAE